MGHGVSVSEVPSGVKPPVQISAGLPVYIGTAPITSADVTNVNKPKLCATLADFVSQFGPVSDDFDSWTLHEAANAHFSVYGVAPIVCINVLDPTKAAHKQSVVGEAHALVAGAVTISVLGIIASSVVVKKGGTPVLLTTDYTLSYDADGNLVITYVAGGALSATEAITVDYDKLKPSGVVAADVIGSYTAGAYSGIEVVSQVYPALRQMPGLLLAPKWSQTPTVAAALLTKARVINGVFRCMAIVDLSTDKATIPTYADAAAWKSTNGYSSIDAIVCWPKSKNGDNVFHLSTVVACVANITDAANGGVPYVSPSNKAVVGTSAVLDDGTEVLLERSQANTLNDQGIMTLLNGFNGWRTWGNRTGGYPGTTDPKDAFIPIRRMFNWIGNTVVLTTDANVDDPIARRLIDLVAGTITSFLNGLTALGALVDGKIEFRSDENPTTDLADGIVRWHLTLTPPSPAQEMEFVLEYDATALAALFQ